MSMTIQAKALKQALRELGIRERGKVPMVRTERRYIGRDDRGALYEYGRASSVFPAHVATDAQLDDLRSRAGFVVTLLQTHVLVER